MKPKPRHHTPKWTREDLTSRELKPLREATINILLGALKAKP